MLIFNVVFLTVILNVFSFFLFFFDYIFLKIFLVLKLFFFIFFNYVNFNYNFSSFFSILIAYVFRFFPFLILFFSKTNVFYYDNAGSPYFTCLITDLLLGTFC